MRASTVKITKIIVIIFYIALFTGLALYDEKPNDEMVKEMTRPLPEVIEPDNAYIAFIGFASPKGITPYDYGAEKMRKLKDALLTEKVTGKMTNPFDHKKNELSYKGEIVSFYNPKMTKILDYAAKHPNEIAHLVQENEELLRRYEMLYRYSHYTEPLDCGFFYPFAEFNLFFWRVQRTKLLQLALRANRGDVAEALAWVRKDAEFWRFIARNSTTFMSKARSFSALSNDLLFVSELGVYQSLNRKEMEMLQNILRPFDHGEVAMAEVLLGEARLTQTALGLWNPQKKRTFELDNFFLKQNATKNRMYAIYQEKIRLAELPPQEFAIEFRNPQTSKYRSLRGIGIPFLYNPVGEILVKIGGPLYGMLIPAHNMEGLRRLAWLKVLAGIEKVPLEKMQQFLDDHARDLGNPYTGGSMMWNPAKGSIYFNDLNTRKKPVEIFL
jgi:hypothetical protein